MVVPEVLNTMNDTYYIVQGAQENNTMIKTIKVNGKRYGLLESNLTYTDAGKLAREWRTLGGSFGKRLAMVQDYEGMSAVFVRPLAYVDWR